MNNQKRINKALDELKEIYPDINTNAITDNVYGNDISTLKNDLVFLKQVETATSWISLVIDKYPPIKRFNYKRSTYNLKHIIERWGQKNGMEKYVSQIATIVALHLAKEKGLKIKLKKDYCNPFTNISERARAMFIR